MKFIVSTHALKRAIGFVIKTVKSNPIVPILDNILFDLQNGTLKLYASDLQTTLISSCQVESSDEGKFTVPAKKLSDLLHTLSEQVITMVIDTEKLGVTIKWDSGKTKLAGENPADWPSMPSGTKLNIVELDYISRAEFVHGLASTVFACSTDDLRPAMTGVYVHPVDEETLKLAATNGHILSVYPCPIKTTNLLSCIIPASICRLILALSEKSDEQATMSLAVTLSAIQVSVGNNTIIGRLIDERFPDYENAIPTNNNKRVTIDKAELISTLKRIMLTAPASGAIRMVCRDGSLTMSSEDLDYGHEASETLQATYEGDEIEIGFNGKLTMAVLSHIDSDSVTLSMSANNRAGIWTGEDTDIFILQMPQMINTYA